MDNNYGEVRGEAGLKFMRVFNAGHMVPLDQPEGSVKMLNDFMKEALTKAEVEDLSII